MAFTISRPFSHRSITTTPDPAIWAAVAIICAVTLTACGGSGSSNSDGGSESSIDEEVDGDDTSTDDTSAGGPQIDDESSTPSDDPQIIVTTPSSENDLRPDGGGMLYKAYDNVAVLDRESDGNETPAEETLRLPIAFSGDQTNPYLRIDSLYTTIQADAIASVDPRIDIVGIMTNVSDTVQCDIRISLDSATETNGNVHTNVLFGDGDVNGAVGDNILDNPSEDCILPATSAYFHIEDPRFFQPDDTVYIPVMGELASVELETISSSSKRSYTFETGVLNTTLTTTGFAEDIVLQNTGTFGFEVTSATAYAIDSEGLPLSVLPLSDRQDDFELQPADSQSLLSFGVSLFRDFSDSVKQYVIVIGYDDL